MKSPYTGGETKLLSEKREFEFRREKFSIRHHFYQCIDTKEEFTTEALDELNTRQLYNQYREKYSIPFPDEILAIRSQYDISATKMAEVLGLGINSYRQYEAGEMPTVSNGRLILAAKDPEEFKKFLDASKAVLNEKEYLRFTERTEELIEDRKKNYWNRLFSEHIFFESKPTELTGYKAPSLDKIACVISFFNTATNMLWKTKLNKLLFYSDFLHYKQTGYSITGMAYRAINLGPVPSEYEKLYIKLSDENLFETNSFPIADNYGETLTAKISFNKEGLEETEMKVLKEVASKFAKLSSADVVKLSHKESAWKENEKDHQLISYQKHAFDLTL